MPSPAPAPLAGTVPVIDISRWSTGSDDDRRTIAAAVDAACRTVGFFQIVGHGFPVDVLERALADVDEFFALPLADKMRSAPPSDDVNRGFLPLGSEALSYTAGVDAPVDLREAFVVGPDVVPDDDVHRGNPYGVFTPNIWPDQPVGLRPAMTAYFDAVTVVARTLVDIYAIALGLPEGWFRSATDHSTETLRVNYYERLGATANVSDGQQRLGAHTDYGITTVLYADSEPGLQLLGSDGRWHDVIAEPGAFVINLGDLLAQWTNDQWRSTIHRVVPVGPHVRRRSIAFFFDGNYDAVVECLPTCCSDERPAKYPPTTAGEHLVEKLRGARTLSISDTIDTIGDRMRAVRD